MPDNVKTMELSALRAPLMPIQGHFVWQIVAHLVRELHRGTQPVPARRAATIR